MNIRIPIICKNDDCPNKDGLINEIICPKEQEDDIYESFGQGGEDPEDFCPKCGQLGEILDPEEISEAVCQHCGKGVLVKVSASEPYTTDHWQCDHCDSTYPFEYGEEKKDEGSRDQKENE